MKEQKQEQGFADMQQDDMTIGTENQQDNAGNFANDPQRASEAG